MQTIRVDRGSFDAHVVRPVSTRRIGRLFEVFAGGAILVGLSPILLMIVIGVRLSGRQVIFSHERVGRDGVPFRCLKFRSMRMDAEERLRELLSMSPEASAEWARDFKLKCDPRVTRFGAFLRRTSLDELPQLFNVLNGDMGLIGPRPIVAEELARYGRYARFYLAMRPGMTGLWQVSGRSDTSYRRRIALDCAYVKHRSLGLDFRILFKTVGVILGRKSGAY